MAATPLPPFHIAVAVRDLEEARSFYGGLLGCAEGRSSSSWIDFDLFGHQYVCHLAPGREAAPHRNPVDGHGVPVPHCGVVLTMERWESLLERLRASGARFAVEPHVRFRGEPGEQATLFLLDPSGNALEFKGFRDVERQLFDRGAQEGVPCSSR